MSTTQPEVVILGGGPAGLGAAFKLREDDKATVTVLERNPAVGGNAGSFELGGQRVDFGSHRLHPSCDPTILRDIRDLLGADLLQRPRHGRIRLRGRWISFPLRPFDLLLRLDRRFAVGALRDMLSPRRRQPDTDDDSFASVLRARLGDTICDQFYLPYATKIWGRDPRRLSAIQARRRVSAGSFAKLLRKVFSSVPGVRPVGFDHYFYPRLGFGQISESYARRAGEAGARVRLREPVVRLRAPTSEADRWLVETDPEQGRRGIEADLVWSTLPVSLLARLMEPAPPGDVLAAAASIHYRAMILVYLQLGVDRFTEFDAHYFPDPDVAITRLSEPKNYSALDTPVGSTVLCAELPCSTDDRYWQMGPEELGRVVIESLARAGLPTSRNPLAVELRRLPQAYPIYDLGFEEHLERIEGWIDTLPRFLTFGRQGLFVHDNTHHALFMAYCAVQCLENGTIDRRRWSDYRRIFDSHVVED